MDNEDQWATNPWDRLYKENAERIPLLGKIVERDGKYYQQFIDGELEVTPEHIAERRSNFKDLARFFEIQTEKYADMDWTLETIPNDLDKYTKTDLLIEKMDIALEQIINEEGGIIMAWPRLRLLLSELVTRAKESQHDYSKSSLKFRKYFKTKLKGLYTRWENIYKLDIGKADHADLEKVKGIFIVPTSRPILINALSTFVELEQKASLEDLINEGIEPENSIICGCLQAQIGRIFYDMVEAENRVDRDIQGDKTVIAKWICKNFKCMSRGSRIKNLTESTILNYLMGKGFANRK